MTVWAPLVMTFPRLPRPSNKESTGRENVPGPSATAASTTKVPVKTEPGMLPERMTVFEDVPSLSTKVNGPGRPTTETEVVRVTVTLPAAVGDGSLRVRVAVGDAEPPPSTAPMSQDAPLLGRLSL